MVAFRYISVAIETICFVAFIQPAFGAKQAPFFADPVTAKRNKCPYVPKPEYSYCAAKLPTSDNYSIPVPKGELILAQVITRHGDRTPKTAHTYTDVTWDCDSERQFSFMSSNLTSIAPERAFIARETVTIPLSTPYARGMWSGSCDIGQLTPRGAIHQRQLGNALRRIYVDKLSYLPVNYTENANLYVRASGKRQTKQSLFRLMAGLYPDSHRPDGSVINMVTVPTEIEYMKTNYEKCPAQKRLLKKMARAKEFKQHLKENKGLMEKLHETLGKPVDTAWPKNIFMAYVDLLLPRRCHLLPLPCQKNLKTCITENDIERVLQMAHWEISFFFRDSGRAERFNRIVIGSFLGELRDRMFRHAKAALHRGDNVSLAVANGSSKKIPTVPRKSFEIYSAHDTTISALLGSLRAREMRWPPYSSSLQIELWRSPGANFSTGRANYPTAITDSGSNRTLEKYDSFFVRILYNGKPVDAPWCDMNACPVRVLWENTKPLVPDDVEEECGVKED